MKQTIECSHADGMVGIVGALHKAQPGDRILIEAGRYLFSDTLDIPTGVVFQGAGIHDTIFVHDGDGPAIQAVKARNVTLKDFSITSHSTNTPVRALPDKSIQNSTKNPENMKVEWGLIWLNICQGVSLTNLEIAGIQANSGLGGLYCRASTSVMIDSVNAKNFARHGIALISTQQSQVQNCIVEQCSSGISLQESKDKLGLSSASILGNRCHGNQAWGIVLFSSESDALKGNECWNNGSGGVLLLRHPDTPESPSRAVIQANRCYGNQGSGIVLLSSESDALTENECWDNGSSGIELHRGKDTPEGPSQAVIQANRCHGNQQAGILLSSSVSSALTENECWDNGFAGIALQRGSDTPDSPSRAVIQANRCYGNQGSGIALLSSESDALTENECWNNGSCGIELYRHPDTPEDPSRAVIQSNRCHGNRHVGILLLSSESDSLTENECWDNGSAGIAVDRGKDTPEHTSQATIQDNRCHGNQEGFVCGVGMETEQTKNFAWNNASPSTYLDINGYELRPLDWALIDPEETEEYTNTRIRNLSFWGKAALQFTQHAWQNSDMMARYVSGAGSLSDLKKWFDVDTLPNVPTKKRSTNALNQNFFELNREDLDRDYERRSFRFKKLGSQTLAQSVWRHVSDHVLNGKPKAVIIGAFGQLTESINDIIVDAYEVNNFDIDNLAVGDKAPTQFSELLRMLPVKAMRIGKPLVYDYSSRSEHALSSTKPRFSFLEPENLGGWGLLRGRIACVARDPAFLVKMLTSVMMVIVLLCLVGYLKGFLNPISDPLGAIVHAISSNINDLQVLDFIALPSVIVGFIVILIALLNTHLPDHMAFSVPSWITRVFGSSDQNRAKKKHGRPWSRWVNQHIFSDGDICFLVLRNLHEWLDEDRVALREILSMRPKMKSLIVI
ncbi:right-handed parallel beta-helix repeat-containing protein, partial [Aliivibrio sp.]|uniref:right-handed parallel beta-helix repeat-containing protein n=1 Tax=Aliivibrio sp. TaxID=1872443 RepID=UPI003D2F2FD5